MLENVTLVEAAAAGEMFEQLFRVGPGDVLVALTFPRYAQTTIRIVRFAKDRGARIVALTDSQLSPIYRLADEALLVPSEMFSFVDSMVAPISMVNALLVALGYQKGSDVSASFAELESIWDTYGVFGKLDDE